MLDANDPLGLPTDEGQLETLLVFRDGNYWPFLNTAAKRMYALAPAKALGRFDELIEAADPGQKAIGLLARAAVELPPNADTIKRLAESSSDVLDEALKRFAYTSRRADVPLLLELVMRGRDDVAKMANSRLVNHAHMPRERYLREIDSRGFHGDKKFDQHTVGTAWAAWWDAHAGLSDQQLAAVEREERLRLFRKDPEKGLSYLHDIPVPSRDLRTIGKLALTLKGESRTTAVRILRVMSETGDALTLELLRAACSSFEVARCRECTDAFPHPTGLAPPLRPQLTSFLFERIEATNQSPECYRHWLDALHSEQVSMIAFKLVDEALRSDNSTVKFALHHALERAPDATKVMPTVLLALWFENERVRYNASELLHYLIGPTNVVDLEHPLREIWRANTVAAAETSERLLTIMTRYPSEQLRSVFADAVLRASPRDQYCGRVGLFLLGEAEHLPAVIDPPTGPIPSCRPTAESVAKAGQADAVIDLLQRTNSEAERWELNRLIGGSPALDAMIKEWRRSKPFRREKLTHSLIRLIAAIPLADRQLTREELEASKIAAEFVADGEPEVVPGRSTWILVRLQERWTWTTERGWVVENGEAAQAVTITLARDSGEGDRQRQSPERIQDERGTSVVPKSPRRDLRMAVRTYGAFTTAIVAGVASCLFERRQSRMDLVACGEVNP